MVPLAPRSRSRLATLAVLALCACGAPTSPDSADISTDAVVADRIRVDTGYPDIPFPAERPSNLDVPDLDAAFLARISITSPANGANVTLASDGSLAVQFFTNITQAPPGACGGVPNCGQIWVNLDGDQCNESVHPYNNTATISPAQALFARCRTRTGPHTITLSLHRDDDTPFLNGATPVTASVMVNVATPGDAGADVPTDRPTADVPMLDVPIDRVATDVPADRATMDVPADRPAPTDVVATDAAMDTRG